MAPSISIHRKSSHKGLQHVYGRFTGSGSYPAGGEVISPAMFGLARMDGLALAFGGLDDGSFPVSCVVNKVMTRVRMFNGTTETTTADAVSDRGCFFHAWGV